MIYTRIAPIASACSDHPDLLHRYMNYTPFAACPGDDAHALAEALILRGCHPLPRRRCFSPTAPKSPTSLPSDPFAPLPDAAVLWPSSAPCRSFSCLSASLGFDPKVESTRFLSARSVLDLPLTQLLNLARSAGATPIRLGLDVGGGTGTLAAQLRRLANATLLTITLDLGAPYSEAAAIRGLVPLHAPLQQRFPVQDGVLDLVRTGHAVNRWIPMPALEFLLYDADRVLRAGGLLWVDHFFCRASDLEAVYAPIISRLGYRRIKWAVANKTDGGGLKNGEVYLTALLQKPLEAKILKLKLMLALKDYSSVISEAGHILKEDEDNLEALLLRGRAYYYLSDLDVAQRHYQKGLRLDPEHSELKKAYFGMKQLLKKSKSAEDNVAKGKLRVAVEDFKAALALDPSHTSHNVHLHLGLCKVLVKLGRGKDAISSCTEALNIDEELVEALVQRGEAKLLTEDWEEAVQDLKIAAEKSPQDMNIREVLMRAEKSLKLSQRKDWYKILGVSKTAHVAEIKRAYKKLALQWHPDKNVDNREEAEAKFQEIAAAYEVLGDDDKRVRYDRGEDLDEGTGMGGGGFNPFGGHGRQYTFHFDGGFPDGGGFPGGFQFNF